MELTIHMRYVEKRFAVPCGCVSRVLDVYRKLKELKLPGAIKCTNMQVRSHVAHRQVWLYLLPSIPTLCCSGHRVLHSVFFVR